MPRSTASDFVLSGMAQGGGRCTGGVSSVGKRSSSDDLCRRFVHRTQAGGSRRLASGASGRRPDVAYGFVAVDFLPPGVLHAGMQRMARMLAAGKVTPLRTTTYGMSSTAAAMRSLAQVLLAFVTRQGIGALPVREANVYSLSL